MDDGGVTEVLSTHTVGSCPGLGQAAQTVEMFHPQLVAGQDCQHHRLMVSGTICCVVEAMYTCTMVMDSVLYWQAALRSVELILRYHR